MLFLLIFGIQIIVARALESHGYTWDSEQLLKQTIQFTQHGNIDTGYVAYLLNFPNNIGIIGVLSYLFAFVKQLGFHYYLTAAIGFNLLIMWLAEWLTFLTCKILYGKRAAIISLLFSFIFINLSMYVQISYTDTLSIVFPIALFYLSLKLVKAEALSVKILLAAAIGLTAVLGYFMKPTVIIALIALIIFGVLWFLGTARRRNLGRTLSISFGCTAACIVSVILGIWVFNKAIDNLGFLPYPAAEDQTASMPLVHFAAMGITTQHFSDYTLYGGYDPQQADYSSELTTKQQKTHYSTKVIGEQLKSYGVGGYADFLMHKTNWILSDSTFYAYQEGSNTSVVFNSQDGLSRTIREFMYPSGRWYALFSNFLQVFWLALLLLIGSQLIIVILQPSASRHVYTAILRLMIAGLLIFLLLFEGRSRYILLYLPIFITTAMYTLSWFYSDREPSETQTRGHSFRQNNQRH
jgi:hypothetical protein